jgi:hypothetical protein
MFKVLDEKVNDWHVIEINEGDYDGIKFTLGEIKFAETPNPDDTYTLSFDYNLIEDYNISNKKEFETLVGDIVTSLIESAVKEADLLLKGGTE